MTNGPNDSSDENMIPDFDNSLGGLPDEPMDMALLATTLELQTPENKAILAAYYGEDQLRANEALKSQLAGKSPSLDSLLTKYEKPKNYLETVDELRDKLYPFKAMMSQLDSTVSWADFMVRDSFHGELLPLKRLVEGIHSCLDALDAYTQQAYYLADKTLHTIKQFAKDRNLAPAELVKNQDYRDEICRRVTPTRSQSDQDWKDSLKAISSVYDLVDLLKTEGPSIGISLEEMKPELDNIPSQKDIRKVHDILDELYRADADRIYAEPD
jgi:hypothetical protein